MSYRLLASTGLGALLLSALAPAAGSAAPLAEPPVFASQGGALDLVMVAKPLQITLDQGVTPTAWVYDVCQRADPSQNDCKDGTHPLGGVRLQLNPGDTLKIRLVNKLPLIPDAKHGVDDPSLITNPTNLHTHGLIVEPHRAEGPSDPYGDYVFVELLNPANLNKGYPSPVPSPMSGGHMGHSMPDLDFATGAVDYAIQIPANHPPGHFWFHPHVHGIALNQVSAGLSGIITIGSPEDTCADAQCVAQVRAGTVRHLTLKDMQILAGNTVQSQEDPAFCGNPPPDLPTGGFCPGDSVNYPGGRWYHTVNGELYPSIAVGPTGDIWRILNSSGSRSYELSLGDDATHTPVLMQVLSIDGVTIDSLALNAPGQGVMAQLLAGKVRPVPCPAPANYTGPGGLCTATLRMMPASRAEVRVVGQKAGSATFRTALYSTGPGGDNWAGVDLAHVTFATGTGVLPPLALGNQATNALGANGVLMGPTALRPRGSFTLTNVDGARAAANLSVTGSANPGNLVQATSIAIDPDLKLGLRSSPDCVPLAPGHHRRIYFGYPTPPTFGLGYVEIDEKGREIASTFKDVTAFDPTTTRVCVPLGAQGQAVKEVWELINLTAEDHNFHIHQTRFRLLQGGTIQGTALPNRTADGLVLHDNVPVPVAAVSDGCDGTIQSFYTGACKPTPVVVEIPFREVGDFVFHCHILEHEDGGMMARIRVVAPPRS